MGFTLRAASVFRAHLAIIAMLLGAHVIAATLRVGFDHPYVFGFGPAFDIDGEGNVPAWFSGTAIFALAVVTWRTGLAAQHAGDSMGTRWCLLALLFAFLACDELFSIHERLTLPMQAALRVERDAYYVWALPYLAGLGLVALGFVRFGLLLDRPTRTGLVSGGLMFIGGAVGMEVVGAWAAGAWGAGRGSHVLCITFEEGLEMLAVAVLLRTVLLHHERRFGMASLPELNAAGGAPTTTLVAPSAGTTREAWLTAAEELLILERRAAQARISAGAAAAPAAGNVAPMADRGIPFERTG